MRAVQSFYARRARDLGHARGRTGAVVCVQRFDSALRLDPDAGAELDGFSLHAAVRVSASGTGARDRLERICRYITRPPLTQERLSLTAEGDVVYRFRHPWKNGKTAVVLHPMTFLSRLFDLSYFSYNSTSNGATMVVGR